VRVFDTADLNELADWLAACGITTVAMESTGVYWIPIAEILEARGMRPCVADARHMKNVPGRRTDWHTCQWIQFLHSVGLLRPAFRPGAQVCALRTMMRLSDMTGLTGLAIIDAILGGEREARRSGTMPRRERSARRSNPRLPHSLAHRGLQAVRGGCYPDPGLGVLGIAAVQRGGPGSVPVEDGGLLRFVAGAGQLFRMAA